MKKIILALLLTISIPALSDTPVGPMNYQGRLLDNNGIPVGYPTPTNVNFVVRVYDAASGGTLKYQENHNAVAVEDGAYSFLVGTQTKSGGDSTWSVELWNCCSALYLEIAVGAETLTPRHRLAAAPFAFQANLALTTNNALKLGNKPAEWYGSTLEAICVSGKGKWLELANDGNGGCLGVGSSFSSIDPYGSDRVPYTALTTNGDFSNLDLTNADISGIQFDDATMTGTLFKNTRYSVDGMRGANLRDTVWDGAVATDMYMGWLSPATRLSGATFTNMDMYLWDLSDLPLNKMDGLSAAALDGCPIGLPAGFACKGKDVGGGDWQYFIVGPSVNLSSTSLMAGKLNTQYTDQWSFQDSNLTGINFSGNTLESVTFPPYNTTNMSNSNFKGATIRNTKLPGIFSGASFDGATLVSSEFYLPTFAPTAPSFDNAELKFVLFNGPADNTALVFTKSILANIELRGAGVQGYGQNISFSADTSRIDTLAISSTLSALTITNSTVAGGINAHPSSQLGAITIGGPEGTTFLGGNLSGRFHGANFTGSVFYGTTFRGAMLNGATGLLPSGLLNVDWFGATCPDGFVVTTAGGTCIGHGI